MNFILLYYVYILYVSLLFFIIRVLIKVFLNFKTDSELTLPEAVPITRKYLQESHIFFFFFKQNSWETTTLTMGVTW